MNVNFKVSTTSLPLAPNQVLGDWIFIVSVLSGEISSLYQRIDSTSASTSLTDVPPGSYMATAQRFDTGGNPFGSQVAASFQIPVPPPVLATDQATALTTDQINAMTTEQVAALGTAEVTALTTDQAPAIAMGDAAASLEVTLS